MVMKLEVYEWKSGYELIEPLLLLLQSQHNETGYIEEP